MAQPNESAVRDEVRSWLDQTWDPDRPLREWRGLLADSGWGCPTWPTDSFGRGLHASLTSVITEQFIEVGAVGTATGLGMGLVAPTLLTHGNAEQKQAYLRPIITGEHRWCQLFSEPGNGSDLAGLTTRAVRDGDEYVVNGQKVWNTSAHHAEYGMLVARTDSDVPKHRGITFFILPMQQDGVEVRPLAQMNYHSSFNEVFMSDARVAADQRVGEEGDGWAVALTTLSHERGMATNRRPRIPREESGRCVQEAAAEAAEYFKTYEWYPQRAGRFDLVIPQAQANGSIERPAIRQQIAELEAITKAATWNVGRAVAARKQGRPPGPEGSLGKLFSSDISRRCAKVHGEIAGADGMLRGPDSPADGMVAEVLISVPGQSIAGGTDEIQHNIIGERTLGLPREPSVDRDIPFRDVRTNTGSD